MLWGLGLFGRNGTVHKLGDTFQGALAVELFSGNAISKQGQRRICDNFVRFAECYIGLVCSWICRLDGAYQYSPDSSPQQSESYAWT